MMKDGSRVRTGQPAHIFNERPKGDKKSYFGNEAKSRIQIVP
jgi:hypothetical protein